MSWWSRIRNAFDADRVRREMEEEQRLHREMRARDLAAAGLSNEEAERAARLRFGNPLALREKGEEVRVAAYLESISGDLRYGLRLIAKSPGFTIAAVLSLSLAIGATTTVFSLLDAVVLRPLPVADPATLVYLTYPDARDTKDPRKDYFNYPLFRDLRRDGRPVIDLFAMSYQSLWPVKFSDSDGDAERDYAQWISGDAFPLLGIRAALGRTLTPDDDRKPGAHPVAVISYALWQRRFGGDQSVLGKRLMVRGRGYEIIGVAQRGFTGIEPGVLTDIWLPTMMWADNAFEAKAWSWFRTYGRLKPGVRVEAARDLLQATFSRFRRENTGFFPKDEPAAVLDRHINGRLQLDPAGNGPSMLRKRLARPLWVLASVVGLVLLLACANLANLLVARAAAREREMALRISIGSGRGRLIRQMILECALLAGAASILGGVFAAWVAPLAVHMMDMSVHPVGLGVGLDWRVLSALATLGTLTTFLFGLLPAWRASDLAPHEVMKCNGERTGSRAGIARWLVAVQVGFCFVILFLSGLFVSTFRNLSNADLGFRPEGLSLVAMDMKDGEGERGAAAWREVRETRAGPARSGGCGGGGLLDVQWQWMVHAGTGSGSTRLCKASRVF